MNRNRLVLPALAAVLAGAALMAAAAAPLALSEAIAAEPEHPGAALYEQRCAACHTVPQPGTRAPALSAMRRMSPEQIRLSMTEGLMQPMAEGLSRRQIAELADYLGDQNTGGDWVGPLMCPQDRRAVDLSPEPTLPMYGVDYSNARALSARQAGLTNRDLADLEVAWTIAFPQTNGLRSQGVIVGKTLFYTAPSTRTLLAIDTADGCVKWAYRHDAPLRTSISFGPLGEGGPLALVFADGRGQVTTVDPATGTRIWKAEGRHAPDVPITGAPILYKDRIIVPVSASDVGRATNPQHKCCTSHGAVVALEAATGRRLWVAHTMEDAKPLGRLNAAGVETFGPSGAPIWATPAIDGKRGLIYAATGENTSPPATETSDAILAIDLATGERKWVFQALARDIWNMSCPAGGSTRIGANCFFADGEESVLKDFDFGAGVVIARRRNGKDILLAGQKSGHVWALDPDNNGALLWSQRFGQGTALGGIHWGLTTDGRRVFAPINDPVFDAETPEPGMNAVDIETGRVLWRWAARPDCANGRAERVRNCETKYGLSAAPFVVDRAVLAGSLDGKLWIFNAADGKVIASHDTAVTYESRNGVAARGGAIDSHSVFAGAGMVFVGSGYGSFSQQPGNVLVAFRPKARRP